MNNNIARDCNPFFLILVSLWLLSSAFKIFFNSNVYIDSSEGFEKILNGMFWISGFSIVFFRYLLVKFSVDSNLKLIAVTVFCSAFNFNILAFSFSLLIWNAIASLMKPKQFIIIYSMVLFLLIFSFMLSVAFYGQTYFHDPRYGNVETFGFVNSNSFPQLLIMFFLISAITPKLSIPLGIVLYFSFNGRVETRTFYLLLILYPLLQLYFYMFRHKKMASLIPLTLFSFSVLLGMIYSSMKTPLVLLLDSILSYRISFGSLMLTALSIKEFLFGAYESTFDSLNIPMDMSYISIVFKYGIISSFILIVLYTKSILRMHGDKDYQLIALVVAFLMYSLVENVLVSYYLNPTLYFIFFILKYNNPSEYVTRKIISEDV